MTSVLAIFASGLLFFSAFFMAFAPLPLLILVARRGPALALASVCVSAACVSLFLGDAYGLLYLSVFASPAIVFGILCFRGGQSLNRSGVAGILTGILMALVMGVVWGMARSGDLGILEWAKGALSGILDHARTARPALFDRILQEEGMTWEAYKPALMWAVPGMTLAFMIGLLALNVLLVSRAVPGILGTPGNRNLSFWRAPELWIWPTLAAGFVILLPESVLTPLGLQTPLVGGLAQTVFSISVVLYGLQGFSILGVGLTRLKIRGLFRSVLFLVVLMTPISLGVVATGFLDTWFDFRKKFGHT